MSRIYDKKNPSADGRTYIPLPSRAKHYVHHPKMRPSMLYLYALIIDYYNVKEGYAYPSIEQLAVYYGMSPNATSDHIEVLRDVGLIDYPEKGRYVPLDPLDAAEFYEAWPDAWAKYQKSLSASERRREADRERLRKWRREKGYE